MRTVRFTAHCGKYQVGEIAGFDDDLAEILVFQEYAEYVDEAPAEQSEEQKQEAPPRRGRRRKHVQEVAHV